ncbi:hypothetical protein GX50_08891 [[Emmonsia] crescens]|uniref:Uncharacterized protein n=1 Tax=[Emmonsia] crescens TaxID=73230 RepID=A0A2B7Z4T1_9EURO|nr:hypothetical protein GX50_08891 [Emmonsia crescens]
MPPTPPTSPPTTIILHVFRGGDVMNDSKATRHASLFIRYPGSHMGTLIHATNSQGPWRVEMRVDYNPATSINIVGSALVCHLPIHPDAVLRVLQQVPIKNELEWNCQHWVGDALQAMVIHQLITLELRSVALDQMVDILIQRPADAI